MNYFLQLVLQISKLITICYLTVDVAEHMKPQDYNI